MSWWICFQFLKKRLLWIKERTGKKLSWMSTSVFFSIMVDFISSLTVHNENNCGLVFLEIGHKYRQQAASHNALATSHKPQISILTNADWRSRTSLVSGVTSTLASITTKHSHRNIIKYLIIFQVTDSEVTELSVHFSRSSFKKILLIFHPTCWTDLHY